MLMEIIGTLKQVAETTNGFVNIRYFYNETNLTNMETAATTFKSDNSSQYKSPQIHFTTEHIGAYPEDLKTDGQGLTKKFTPQLSVTFNNFNSQPYAEYSNIDLTSVKGGAVLQQITNRAYEEENVEKGTLRFNRSTKKFEGWNGVEWVIFN